MCLLIAGCHGNSVAACAADKRLALCEVIYPLLIDHMTVVELLPIGLIRHRSLFLCVRWRFVSCLRQCTPVSARSGRGLTSGVPRHTAMVVHPAPARAGLFYPRKSSVT